MEEEEKEESTMAFRMFIPAIITWLCIVAQIILTFVLWTNFYDLDFLLYIGYAFWGLGAIFGVVPIIQFKMHGGVKKGESYIKTTKIVSTGLYAIVRHPQYLAGIIISMALAFLSQHWVVDVLVIPIIVFTYIDTFNEDKRILTKFGEDYEEYMRKVPRLEPISGTIRWSIRKIRENRQKKNQ